MLVCLLHEYRDGCTGLQMSSLLLTAVGEPGRGGLLVSDGCVAPMQKHSMLALIIVHCKASCNRLK